MFEYRHQGKYIMFSESDLFPLEINLFYPPPDAKNAETANLNQIEDQTNPQVAYMAHNLFLSGCRIFFSGATSDFRGPPGLKAETHPPETPKKSFLLKRPWGLMLMA